MPLRPKKTCNAQGCNVLTRNPRYCDAHTDIGKSAEAKRHERKRETSSQRGYSYKWQQARKAYLAKYPLCVECERQGLVVAANHVDHIRPHKGDWTIFWDSSNWQPLCHPCHSRKTATEDGGWGNPASNAAK
ncbi:MULTISPECIES: HNH endonuclease [unclassified Pseudomonas]|uniref:HNH endonuclease n=1 Tax=unclassified Pseudomonas TaxID=196821 RepID=UPI0015A40D23|nr:MULTISPECIES: HNH endonuclease signature motif containing protein [unclassified Pseudomonas]NWC96088.1 HNH endonuclease [Pseudomonas sp. IPO3779]NWD20991.1 HNH endonuclease [Pseudomonas sp. IPO3778]